MSTGEDLPQLGIDDFTRRFALRGGNLMWFLGAGASASAGIATALDMVWEFKQLLYVNQRRVALQTVADLSNPAIRAQVCQQPARRRNTQVCSRRCTPPSRIGTLFLDAQLSGAKPSYGHLALAALMRARLTQLVWTTNFDPLVADSCARRSMSSSVGCED
jgi:hypothetical protein